MPVSNEEMMEKLNKIESMLAKLTKEEEEVFEEVEGEKNKQYEDPDSWRAHIWDNCEFKEERPVGEEVDFWCKKQNKPCRFKGCPENVKS